MQRVVNLRPIDCDRYGLVLGKLAHNVCNCPARHLAPAAALSYQDTGNQGWRTKRGVRRLHVEVKLSDRIDAELVNDLEGWPRLDRPHSAPVRTLRARAECSSVVLQGLMARGSEVSSRKAVANGEWTSGVSSASNTQVSR